MADRGEDVHQVRPSYKGKFKPAAVQALIKDSLQNRLQNEAYNQDTTPGLTREIADQIKNELRKIGLPRYKFVVQVIIGEQRGAGMRMTSRCFWDPECDDFASETYINDSLFCTLNALQAAAWAIYLY